MSSHAYYEDARNHQKILVTLNVASRLITGVLILLSTYLPAFDDAPALLMGSVNGAGRSGLIHRWASSLMRWDAFHFVHVAQRGYVYEYEFAFLPGTPAVMRGMAELGRAVGLVQWSDAPAPNQLLVGGGIAALLCDASLDLYK